ncbi:hypothetical protein J2X71_007262 [Rhizobium sp. 1399]|nr:hypothetical protein [Rhizobium sp. 1399]
MAIVVHNYRWRLGLAPGEDRFNEYEAALTRAPDVSVPTITLEGDANGAPHPAPKAYAKFKGRYEYRLITGGIGHAFAQAVMDVDAWG